MSAFRSVYQWAVNVVLLQPTFTCLFWKRHNTILFLIIFKSPLIILVYKSAIFINYTPIDFVELEEDVPSHEEVQFLHNRNLR
ncbi:hypothetical protein BpHYR1_040292, partial [Brachionus plicatilis]